MTDHDVAFDDWLRELRETVIEGEFGYEPGEFAVYPAHWRPFYDKGLTPRQAWLRALDAHRKKRRTLGRAQSNRRSTNE